MDNWIRWAVWLNGFGLAAAVYGFPVLCGGLAVWLGAKRWRSRRIESHRQK